MFKNLVWERKHSPEVEKSAQGGMPVKKNFSVPLLA